MNEAESYLQKAEEFAAQGDFEQARRAYGLFTAAYFAVTWAYRDEGLLDRALLVRIWGKEPT